MAYRDRFVCVECGAVDGKDPHATDCKGGRKFYVGGKMPNDVQNRLKKSMKNKRQKGSFKLSEGPNTIRVLPTPESSTTPALYYEYLVHRDVGPKKRLQVCGKTMAGKGKDWLCDKKIPDLLERGKDQTAANLKPKEQMVVQVAVIDDDGEWTGPFIWYVPTGKEKSLSYRILQLLSSKKRDYADAKRGYNFTIERTGTGQTDTRYGSPEPDDESSKVPKSILAKLKPFSEVLTPYSELDQKAAWLGKDRDELEAESDEDEDDDDMAMKENKKKKKKREEEDEEEVDETEDEDEEENEDEDEDDEPKSKKKSKKKKKDDDEDEEDEDESDDDDEDEESDDDEDEDDEDEKPKKKKKGKPSKKKKKDDDDEDEDEDSDDDDEDEEESDDDDDEDEDDKPKKGKKAKKGKKKKDDDDDDD